MLNYQEQRARLARMVAACQETERHLESIERQIAAAAERQTIIARPKTRQFGRGRTTWTPADERYYRAVVERLTTERQPEILALTRKLERQRAAIEASRRRLGINEPLGMGALNDG